jgi:hypothetical protein
LSKKKYIETLTPKELAEELAEYVDEFGDYVSTGFYQLSTLDAIRPPSTYDWNRYILVDDTPEMEPLSLTFFAHSEKNAVWAAEELEADDFVGRRFSVYEVSLVDRMRHATPRVSINESNNELVNVGIIWADERALAALSEAIKAENLPDPYDAWASWGNRGAHTKLSRAESRDILEVMERVVAANPNVNNVKIYAGFNDDFYWNEP